MRVTAASVILVGILGVTPASAVAASPRQAANAYIRKHGFDARRLQATIINVKIALGQLAQAPTQAKVNRAAFAAQDAHDFLNTIRSNFTYSDSGTLGKAEGSILLGANDLKNSMGALVAYLGTPNAASLAHFRSQYQQGVGEWDSGVRVVWRLAHRLRSPIV